MGRRTISNLAREMKVSRPTIYAHLEKLGISKPAAGEEYSPPQYEQIKESIKTLSIAKKRITKETSTVAKSERVASKESDSKHSKSPTELSRVSSTIRVRLDDAKSQYDYNKELIRKFQLEVDSYHKSTGRTTTTSHNGTLVNIPALNNLEKWQKANVVLSKLINELESDLDLEETEVGKESSPYE